MLAVGTAGAAADDARVAMSSRAKKKRGGASRKAERDDATKVPDEDEDALENAVQPYFDAVFVVMVCAGAGSFVGFEVVGSWKVALGGAAVGVVVGVVAVWRKVTLF